MMSVCSLCSYDVQPAIGQVAERIGHKKRPLEGDLF